MISFGVASGWITASGCGSKVSTVSAPRITSRWPRCTPSNVPIATLRGPRARLDVGSETTFMRARTLRRACSSAARGSAMASSSPSRVRRTCPSAPAPAGTRSAVAHRGLPHPPRARARAGRRAPRASGTSRSGSASSSRNGPIGGALELLAVGVAKIALRASARMCPTSTRSRSAARSPSCESSSARWTVTGRGCELRRLARCAPARRRARPPTFTAE